MKDKDKLHVIINNIHHAQSSDRNYIALKMYKQYGIPIERTQQLINECLDEGSLIPDRDGFISIKNSMFESRSFQNKLSRKLFTKENITLVASIATILTFLYVIYSTWFKR